MEIKTTYGVYNEMVGGRELTEKEYNEFNLKLETLMNEYEIFKISATLNPFDKGVKMVHKTTE